MSTKKPEKHMGKALQKSTQGLQLILYISHVNDLSGESYACGVTEPLTRKSASGSEMGVFNSTRDEESMVSTEK